MPWPLSSTVIPFLNSTPSPGFGVLANLGNLLVSKKKSRSNHFVEENVQSGVLLIDFVARHRHSARLVLRITYAWYDNQGDLKHVEADTGARTLVAVHSAFKQGVLDEIWSWMKYGVKYEVGDSSGTSRARARARPGPK